MLPLEAGIQDSEIPKMFADAIDDPWYILERETLKDFFAVLLRHFWVITLQQPLGFSLTLHSNDMMIYLQ